MEQKKTVDTKEKKKLDAIKKKQWALAEKFKEEVLKKYKNYVKAVVLFGSLVRGDFHEKSDIDMQIGRAHV